MTTRKRHPETIERDCAVASLLLGRAATFADIGKAFDMTQDAARGIVRRLREFGVPVIDEGRIDTFSVGTGPSFYRVKYPKGRVCGQDGCGTILSVYNPSTVCNLHGGGTFDDVLVFGKPLPQCSRPRECCRCGDVTTDFPPDPNKSYCRPCTAEMRRDRRAKGAKG